MHVVWANEPVPESFAQSVFLAGPTGLADAKAKPSWRWQALEELRAVGYRGVVFAPEREDGSEPHLSDQFLSWEEECLELSDLVIFWIPVLRAKRPARYAVQWGAICASRATVLGIPKDAEHRRYLLRQAKLAGRPTTATLHEAALEAVSQLGEGALRAGGERYVPLHVWRTPVFLHWLDGQRAAGNTLTKASLEWVLRLTNSPEVFAFALDVDIHIGKENRYKRNEVLLARPDMSVVLAFRPSSEFLDTEVVLVREFRAPSRTQDGFVWELPSGAVEPGEATECAAAREFREETGASIPQARLERIETRQVSATFSAHSCHLHRVELSAEEAERLRRDCGTHGEGSTERTRVFLRRIREVLLDSNVDWSHLGMILAGLKSGGVP